MRFEFKTCRPGNVKLTILSPVGIKIEELSQCYMCEGCHVINWKPKCRLNDDVLSYRIELDEHVIAENLFVVK